MKEVKQEIITKKLKRQDEIYERNFQLLKNSAPNGIRPNKKLHKFYLKREVKLNVRDIALRKHFGAYVPDPCPLQERVSKSCEICVGYYKQQTIGKTMKGMAIKRNKRCQPNVCGAQLCRLKNIKR